MKKFGFCLKQSLELAQAADELGVNGAYFRVYHFAPQAASPMPLLGAIAGSTTHIEVGTGVIDMRYDNPLYLAEEAAACPIWRGRSSSCSCLLFVAMVLRMRTHWETRTRRCISPARRCRSSRTRRG